MKKPKLYIGDNNLIKTCSDCGHIKEIGEFHKNKNGLFGVRGNCKHCRIEYNRTYSKNYAKTPKGIITCARSIKKYQSSEKYKTTSRLYWQNHKEALNRKTRNAKIKRKIIMDQFEPIDHIRVANRDQWTCYLCNKQIEGNDLSIDHVIPLSKGGSHTYENVKATHLICNLRKGTKLIKVI